VRTSNLVGFGFLLCGLVGLASMWSPSVAPRAAQVLAQDEARPVHAQVMARVARDLPRVRHPAQLDAYLDELVREAIAKGQVSALQIEPGMHAIARFSGELGEAGARARARAFSARMRAVGKETRR
jgi:hypothetical protein